MRVYDLLGDMSFDVVRINSVRDALAVAPRLRACEFLPSLDEEALHQDAKSAKMGRFPSLPE